ncbi:MAG: hypothetical protein WD155_01355, partial [Burkholderiales bacterium]
MPAANRLFILLVVLPLAACVALAQTDGEPDAHDQPPQSAVAEPSTANLPEQELTEPLLYEMLLAEIALQRGNPALAAQTYADLAK